MGGRLHGCTGKSIHGDSTRNIQHSQECFVVWLGQARLREVNMKTGCARYVPQPWRKTYQHQAGGSPVWNILHENCYYPYHVQRVQGLLPRDYPPRERFCRWLIEQFTRNRNFMSSILFTDEATFTRGGIINLHNNHIWDLQNPHAMVEVNNQHRFSLNVWAGIIGDRLVGPVILPERLTGEAYLNFLQVTLPPLLEDVPCAVRMVMWLLHDGAPAHFRITVRRHLNTIFPGRWIGRGGPIPWPPRSPDLNPIDFYLWGHLKGIVYSEPIPDVQTLEQHIRAACDAIRIEPGIFERVRQSLLRRVQGCLEARGSHFQHLL